MAPTRKGVGMDKGDEYSFEYSTKTEWEARERRRAKGKGREEIWLIYNPLLATIQRVMIRSLVPSAKEQNGNSSWIPEYSSCLTSKQQRVTLHRA